MSSRDAWDIYRYADLAAFLARRGKYFPNKYEPRPVAKPDGRYIKPSHMDLRTAEEVRLPRKEVDYEKEQADTRSIFRPSGAYNPGAFDSQRRLPDLDPWGNYQFGLEIAKQGESPIEVAHFNECNGLKNACTPFEIVEGGMNGRTYKRPDRGKWENIVLKYSTSASTYLLAWRDNWLSSPNNWTERTKYGGSITLKDNYGNVLRRYVFKNAWPVSWEGPAFNGGSSDIAVETLEIAHDGLEIKDQ